MTQRRDYNRKSVCFFDDLRQVVNEKRRSESEAPVVIEVKEKKIPTLKTKKKLQPSTYFSTMVEGEKLKQGRENRELMSSRSEAATTKPYEDTFFDKLGRYHSAAFDANKRKHGAP